MISNELILAGKLQLKKLQKKKPEKKKKCQASFSAISLIAVYLRGSIRYLCCCCCTGCGFISSHVKDRKPRPRNHFTFLVSLLNTCTCSDTSSLPSSTGRKQPHSNELSLKRKKQKTTKNNKNAATNTNKGMLSI